MLTETQRDGWDAIVNTANEQRRIIPAKIMNAVNSHLQELELDRVSLRILSQMICEAHTHTGGVHDAAYYDRLYEVAYNALSTETRAQFPHPDTFERATHTDLQPGVHRVDFDGNSNAHFGPVMEDDNPWGEPLCECGHWAHEHKKADTWSEIPAQCGYNGRGCECTKGPDDFVWGKFCDCNPPGVDAGNPTICPTCKKPHRI